MRFDLLHPADQIVMIMQRIYTYGMTTTSGGNLSILDDNGDIWITPSGIDKGALTRDDIIRVTSGGEITGRHKPSVEFPFHHEIYQRRPDLKAILHAHPPTMVAFSLARVIPDIRLVPDVLPVCGNIAMAEYEVPGSRKLGDSIARKFGEGYNTVMLENHGCVLGAAGLFQAFMAFETLDFCGRLQIDARKLGTPRKLTDEQIEKSGAWEPPAMAVFTAGKASAQERAARRDMCTLIHRAYDQRLFTSTQGTFSMRLPDGSFLITPFGKDRKYLEPEDIVLVCGNRCEQGKIPSRSVYLHKAIYEKHSGIGSVIIAHAPAIMAFAVTDAVFDSRIIPESYILLRDVRRLPYLSSLQNPESTAEVFSSDSPAVIEDNRDVIVTGETLLGAFDRMEVLEYSAKAVIAARDIGPTVAISDAQVREIREAFNLS
jgi:L-fuculose-phosphate aldolase